MENSAGFPVDSVDFLAYNLNIHKKYRMFFLWILKEQKSLFCEFLWKNQWFSTKEIQINPFFGVVFLAGVYYNKCGQESVKTEKSVDNYRAILQMEADIDRKAVRHGISSYFRTAE